MLNWNVSRDFARRTLALAAVLGTGVAVMGAQTHTTATDDTPTVSATVQAQPALFSSSAEQTAAAPALEASLLPANPFGDPMQYGGGQRSRAGGRPRYRGSNTNADGSNKYIFYGGFGLQQPVGNTFHYFTPSWGLQVGGGRQFSKHFAVPIEFDYDHAGLSGQALGNQLTLYNNDINYYCTLNPAICAADQITDFAALDGNMHIWSFTIDPTETFYQGDKWGAYGVEGVGFYHKVTNFLAPETGCDPYALEFYGICETVQENAVIDHYTSNAPGFSAGLGLTYKFSHFSNERFYAEARYVFVDNAHRAGVTVTSPVATTYAEANDFPANSNHTSYFPIKFGIRF